MELFETPSSLPQNEALNPDALLSSGGNSYLVLARKWRPAQFSDIVGQNHIIRTLTNAVMMKRVHHAYLFTGSRGIGKTSIARIYSKILRCASVTTVASAEGETLKSCDQCAFCREIALGNSVDVREIDGASNNGVEAIREIRDDAKVLPSAGDRKIFIIDEVHMLTTAAFNALLKLLEEPPAHVTFIFATTEPHKIPATILSRCQRFDYRRVSSAQIQQRLQLICEHEKIEVEPGVFALVAQAAEGSMRDSLSLLDQILAYCGNKITLLQARDCIGLISGHRVLDVLEGVFLRRPSQALEVVDQCYRNGQDLRILAKNLAECMHAAILQKVGISTSVLAELAETEQSRLAEMVTHRSIEELELIFQAIHQSLEWIARSPQPKIVIDILLIKCALSEQMIPMVHVSEPQTQPILNTPVLPAADKAVSPIPPPAPLHREGRLTPQPLALQSAPPRPPNPGAALAEPPPHSPSPSQIDPKSEALSKVTPLRGVAPPNWESLIERVRRQRPLLASILEHAAGASLPTEPAPFAASNPPRPEGASTPPNPDSPNNILIVYFKPEDSYFKEQLQSRVYQEQMQNLCKEAFGRPIRLQIENRDSGESVAQKRDRQTKMREQNVRSRAESHPILKEARTLFGGELGPILLSTEIQETKDAQL